MARQVATEDEAVERKPKGGRKVVEEESAKDVDPAFLTDEEEKARDEADDGEIDVGGGNRGGAGIPAERLAQEERIIDVIVGHDPEALFNELDKLQTVGLSLLSVMKRQAHVLEKQNKASELAMITRRDAKVFVEVEKKNRMAELRARALEEMPREKTADGKKDKAPTLQQVEDFLRITCAADMERLGIQEIELQQLAEHAERVAKNWAYYSKTLESLSSALRATGDADRDLRGEDD